jgi:hypothetical protein
MTGQVKAKYGRRGEEAKSEDAPRLDAEDGTAARHGKLNRRWTPCIGVVMPWCQSRIKKKGSK